MSRGTLCLLWNCQHFCPIWPQYNSTTLHKLSTEPDGSAAHTRFGHLLHSLYTVAYLLSLTVLAYFAYSACYIDPFHCKSLHRARSSTIPGPACVQTAVMFARALNHKSRRLSSSALVTMISPLGALRRRASKSAYWQLPVCRAWPPLTFGQHFPPARFRPQAPAVPPPSP